MFAHQADDSLIGIEVRLCPEDEDGRTGDDDDPGDRHHNNEALPRPRPLGGLRHAYCSFSYVAKVTPVVLPSGLIRM